MDENINIFSVYYAVVVVAFVAILSSVLITANIGVKSILAKFISKKSIKFLKKAFEKKAKKPIQLIINTINTTITTTTTTIIIPLTSNKKENLLNQQQLQQKEQLKEQQQRIKDKFIFRIHFIQIKIKINQVLKRFFSLVLNKIQIDSSVNSIKQNRQKFCLYQFDSIEQYSSQQQKQQQQHKIQKQQDQGEKQEELENCQDRKEQGQQERLLRLEIKKEPPLQQHYQLQPLQQEHSQDPQQKDKLNRQQHLQLILLLQQQQLKKQQKQLQLSPPIIKNLKILLSLYFVNSLKFTLIAIS